MTSFKDTLKPTYFMDYEHPIIQEKARTLTKGIPEDDDIHKAIKLFYFVRDNIKYSVKNARESYNK